MNLRILAACLLLAPALATTAAQAYDTKLVGPGDCQPYGQSSTYETLAIRADGVQNKTANTNKYFICPLNRDGEDDWSADNGLSTVLYFVHPGNGSIQCTLTVGTDLAGVASEAPSTQTVNAVPYVGDLKIVVFEEAAGPVYQTATVTCRIPPLAKLSFIQYSEAVETAVPAISID